VQTNNLDSSEKKKFDYLKNIYFFHGMADVALEKIRALCSEERFTRGTVLFFEDTPGDHFFVILDGELEIWKRFGQPDELLLGVSGAGQPIGEMALIDDRPRSATVRARTDVRVLVIHAEDFNELLKTEHAIALTLLKAVTMMVRRSNESHIADLDRQNHELARAYSELKAAQDELVSRERLSVVGRFSSLILHDIRNPLSALRSRVELLRVNIENREYVEQSIEKINNDISRMEMLAAEFLDYARGEIRLQMSICQLDALFARFRESISSKVERSGVLLAIENAVTSPVILDEERVLRLLINAGENACKAMPNGGSLTVTARTDKNSLCIDISDTGVGMSSEVLSNIFKPFYSASASGGTGLGMIIIKSIVDAHHGEVFVHSTEGVGTRISIVLPLLT
jgi:signal transduction histidine kinase